MAPELFEEHGVFSFSSDIWSLGILLYELASGSPPFMGENFTEIAQSIVKNKLRNLQKYSNEFNNLVSLMLDKNPASRITWEELVKHPWWGNMNFQLPDIPDQPHFEEFLQKYGYLRELERVRAGGGDDHGTEILGDNVDLVNRMRSDQITSKSKRSDANIMRLSLNVGKNIMREKEELIDIRENQKIKIEKDQVRLNPNAKKLRQENFIKKFVFLFEPEKPQKIPSFEPSLFTLLFFRLLI